MSDWPSFILGCIVAAYWFCVGAMIVRVTRRKRKLSSVAIPAQARERIMWVIWVPLIASWITVPFLIATGRATAAALTLPDIVGTPALAALRWLATAAAFTSLAISIQCWRHMGRDWRMGVDPDADTRLIKDGPFARVRHPIYALSVLLMTCSAIIAPAPVMIAIALIHITLMHIKARNEEAFLLEKHGRQYQDYCNRTGRFVPRLRSART